ncbi:MAG: CinA family protein [Deltaproteobacteria bacterium]|nr:CinA family protein [Deltaproteobacteria bacterium]
MAGRLIRELAERLGASLSGGDRLLAVAESCTGGGLCAAITEIPGSSRYFLGGVVAYHNAVKTRAIDVPEDRILSEGAVSEPVAISMAEGVKRRFGSDIGVGVTGVAGPGGGTPEKPVGTVCLGITAEGVRFSARRRFAGDREAVRNQAVAWALEELLRCMPAGRGRKE